MEDINTEEDGKFDSASVDAYLYEVLEELQDANYSAKNRDLDDNELVIKLPDGVYRFDEASSSVLRYDFRVNDKRQF